MSINDQMGEDFIEKNDTFAALLRSAEEGNLINELGGEVQDAIKQLRRHADKTNRRAKGVLTLKVKLEADGKGVLETEAEFSVKLPKLTRARTIHWADEEGEILNRRPEKQLELKGINGGAATAANAAEIKEPAPTPVRAM